MATIITDENIRSFIDSYLMNKSQLPDDLKDNPPYLYLYKRVN